MKQVITALAIATALLLAGCGQASAQQVNDCFVQVDDKIELHVVSAFDYAAGIRAAQEAAEAVEYDGGEYFDESYEEYCEPAYYGGNDYNNQFKQDGEASDDNYQYTWYSQNVLPGGGLTELNENGRHVDEDTGFIVDGDGYIAVAMNGVDKGTVIDTKWGQAKVYDTKDDDAPYDGTVDVYTDF